MKSEEISANHGLPKSIVSENSPQFVSAEFENFCKANGMCHIKVVPFHPASNGHAERDV